MKFKIPSDFKSVKEVSKKVLQCLNKKKLSEAFLFDVKLACEEAMINAIKYGNKSDRSKAVSIDCQILDEAVVISVEDGGQGFNYKDLPDPTLDENLEKNGGRGLFLIRNLMDKVEFNTKGNRITMTKLFK